MASIWLFSVLYLTLVEATMDVQGTYNVIENRKSIMYASYCYCVVRSSCPLSGFLLGKVRVIGLITLVDESTI